MWLKNTVSERELIEAAFDARKKSYSPYSGYSVGACILTENGIMYKGANIENASYGATNCAERTALFKAVSEGERSFCAIAIVGGKSDEEREVSDYAFPCGICRQVLREFTDPKSFKVIVAKSVNDYKQYTLDMLLPESFGPEKLSDSKL